MWAMGDGAALGWAKVKYIGRVACGKMEVKISRDKVSVLMLPNHSNTTHAALAKLADAGPPAEAVGDRVFKRDRRSSVWRVEVEGESFVIKRFEYAPWQQFLARLIFLHPCQVEMRTNRKLLQMQLSTVGVEATGYTSGGRAWLATRWTGKTISQSLRGMRYHERKMIAEDLAKLLEALINKKIFFRDIKTTNLVVKSDGTLAMIDVGSAKYFLTQHQIIRMLSLLDRCSRRDCASRMDQLRVVKLLVSRVPALGELRELVRVVRAISVLGT